MKQLVVILFSFLILLSSARDLVTYVHFKVNQDYIANTFCINLDKPEVMCFGSCFLQDSIEENHDSDQELPVSVNMELVTVNYLLPEMILLDFTALNKVKKSTPLFREKFASTALYREIFHPPKSESSIS